jgi:hypothetical protein
VFVSVQVSFLLPADHGLDPTKTWVGLVQQLFGGLQCMPCLLSEFQSEPLMALSPLLLPHPLSAVQLQTGVQPAAAAAAADSAEAGGSSVSAEPAASGQKKQQLQLQLVDLQESTTSYTATIKLVSTNSSTTSSSSSSSGSGVSGGSSGGQAGVACSGLTAKPVVMVAGAVAAATSKAPSHEVVLRLAQPPGVPPFRLQLLHPVQGSNAGGWICLFACRT